MEFLDHCPLEGEKLQFVCWVMGFSLAQAPTGIGYHCFSAILSCLVEDSSQTSATSISMKPEWLCKVGICRNRCRGTQCLQVIKGLLTPAVPLNGSLLLACIFTQCYFMQRTCHLHEFGAESVVVSHESQETLNLCDVSRCGPVLDSLNFAFISGYSFGRDDMTYIGLLPPE